MNCTMTQENGNSPRDSSCSLGDEYYIALAMNTLEARFSL
jgi:hypothetical protein